MGDDVNGDSKPSESDSSTWDFGGEETQIVDTQCVDSPTSSLGNKFNGDDADEMHNLQNTIPFDDTAIFEDDLATQLMDPDGETQAVDICGETQVVDFDTEIDEMDILDSVERNATQIFNDSDTEELVVADHEETQKIEVVDDSDEDSSRIEYKSKTDCGRSEQHTSGSGFKTFISMRAASVRAAGLAARNKASQMNKSSNESETGSRCGFGRSTARKLFAEETLPETKEGNDNIDLCGTADLPWETDMAGLSYLDSQEPGEASQQNALDFVDNFLKVNIECSDKCDTNKSSERKSKPVLNPKGIQTLAKSCNLMNAAGEREVFNWDNDREDEGGGEFFKRKKDVLFASRGRKSKASSFPRKGRKLGESTSKEHGLVCSDSKLGLANHKANAKSNFQETNDVRFDTQMAAEAMENLCFGLHTAAHDSTKGNEGSNNAPKGSHKSQRKEKALILQTHRPPPLSNGVRTRQSKLKKTVESETHDTVPLKESKRAKKNVASDVGKREKLSLKRRQVDTVEAVTSGDQMLVKKQRTRQSVRGNKSEKVKDASNNLTEEINIPAGFHLKRKRTCQKLSSVAQEGGCPSISRLTRSKAAILTEDKNGTCTEGSPSEKIESVPSTCTTPVSHGTPLKESSPICMGDEYLKQSWKKSRLRSSIIQEPAILTPTRVEFTSPTKDTRKRKDMSMTLVLFSRHLDGDIVKHQKKILSRLQASEACSMSDATHFIADEFVRTRNMLEAIAFGKPVVTHLWLESCKQAHCHIDEKNFILRDAKKETEFGFNLPASLAQARKDPILKGHRVLITPNTKPGKEILSSLVKAVGGVVVERLGRTAVKDDKIPEGLILSCEEDYALCLPFLEKGAAVYSSELLLNGIVTQRLEYERHRLFLDHVKRSRSKSWLKKV